jgi:hypothetical protein
MYKEMKLLHSVPFDNVCAVIPVNNEADAIGNVLRQLHRARIHHCVLVLNGCVDSTQQVAQEVSDKLNLNLKFVIFPEKLGPDVPRSVGTFIALRTFHSMKWILYVDGDWLGSFGPALEDFVQQGIVKKIGVQWVGSRKLPESVTWLSLYRFIWYEALARDHSCCRHALPSLLPMLVNRRVFQSVSAHWLHHPGKWFAYCIQTLTCSDIRIFTDWNPVIVGNPTRTGKHQIKMALTLAGDAIEGKAILNHLKLPRKWMTTELNGYHAERRIDVLNHLRSTIQLQPFV